eukprot:11893627-Alexandrium_andersonii.AAC.1
MAGRRSSSSHASEPLGTPEDSSALPPGPGSLAHFLAWPHDVLERLAQASEHRHLGDGDDGA